MKKKIFPVLLFLFAIQMNAQIADRITDLPEAELKGYANPLATWTGTYLNSGGYYSANVSTEFVFKLSLIGMMIMVPDDQTTFELDNGEKSATFFGDKGAAIAGSSGYAVYPPGINETSVPTAMPQIAFATSGSEVMLRLVPTTTFDDVEVGLFGVGVKHSISQYIRSSPVDIAVQLLYNKVSIESPDLDISTSNFAFNAHASRSFGLLTLYGGLQYESTSMDINYTFTGAGFEGIVDDEKFSLSLDGDNNVRLTLGAALRLAVIVINADINFGSQTALVAGLNFEF
jgi:Family of unknown function (DUF6588)